jgi:hypothetical protein
MKKLILALAVITFTAASVKAQDKTMASKKTNVEIGANVAFPVSTGWSIGFGADLQVNIPVAEMVDITASGGYENFSYKASKVGTITIPEGNVNFIPVLAGIKYHFSEKFYGHGQLGYAFSTLKNGGGAFSYVPSIGYAASKNFDIALKFYGLGKANSNSSALNSVMLRLAYGF